MEDLVSAFRPEPCPTTMVCLPARLPSSQRPQAPTTAQGPAPPCPQALPPSASLHLGADGPHFWATQHGTRGLVPASSLGKPPGPSPLSAETGAVHAPDKWMDTGVCTHAPTHEGPPLARGSRLIAPK